jgi:hypothetical protein
LVIQEQVEIEQPAVWPPRSEDSVHLPVIRPLFSPQPTLHLVLAPHVVSGEHIQPAQPSQQYVLCGPASDSLQRNQTIQRFSGIQYRKILQI